MQFANPFKQKGIWLKGNTHTHSRASDGALTVAEIGQTYRRHGYDFVFLTDHWKRTAPPAGLPAKPLLIPAEELDFWLDDNMYHVVCLGLRREWKPKVCRSWNALRRQALREKALLILAHPYWSGNRLEPVLSARLFTAVEVYNGVCDGLNAKGCGNAFWDDMLHAGQCLTGIATDDMHWRPNVAQGWIMVKAKARTAASILDAIRRGCFYSTQGPEIRDIIVRGRRVEVTCSPAQRINFVSNRWNGNVQKAGRRPLTRAAWEAIKGVTYARVEIVDRQGRTAWSNPVFFNKK